jgi:hypothetical protein
MWSRDKEQVESRLRDPRMSMSLFSTTCKRRKYRNPSECLYVVNMIRLGPGNDEQNLGGTRGPSSPSATNIRELACPLTPMYVLTKATIAKLHTQIFLG